MMANSIRTTFFGLTLLAWAASAAAGQITITFTGLDATYDGLDLYDAGSPFGGNQNANEADPLTSVSFYENLVLVGTLHVGVHADFALVNLVQLPVGGGSVQSAFGGFFDLLITPGGWGLGLDLADFSAVYDGATGLRVSAVSSAIAGQALPFGLVATHPIWLTLDLRLANLIDDGSHLTAFDASGRAAVPEPASGLLAGLAAIGIWHRRRRVMARARGSNNTIQ